MRILKTNKIKIWVIAALLPSMVNVFASCYGSSDRICHTAGSGTDQVNCAPLSGSSENAPSASGISSLTSCPYSTSQGTVSSYTNASSGFDNTQMTWFVNCNYTKTYTSGCCLGVAYSVNMSSTTYSTSPIGNACNTGSSGSGSSKN